MTVADRWKHLAQTGQTIPCRSMTLLAGDHEPSVVEGIGHLVVQSPMSIGYELRGMPLDLGHAMRSLNRIRSDAYNGLLRQRLEVISDDGLKIGCGWTIPKVHVPDTGGDWTFSGDVEALMMYEAGISTAGTEVAFLLPRGHRIRIILRRFFPKPDKAGAAVENRITVLGTEITFILDDAGDILIIRAPASKALPPTYTENWLCEPLRIMFGQLTSPRFVARALQDRTMICIRPSPEWSSESDACALWQGDDCLTDIDGFWQTYARLLTYIALARDEVGRPSFEANKITELYVEVIRAAHGSRWVWALTCASAIEGMVRLIVPRGSRRTDIDAADIDALRSHIDGWSGDLRLKEIVKNAASRALDTSAVQALRQLRDDKVVTPDHFKAWDKIRNKVMHGSLVSPYSSAEDDKILLDLAGLLHELTRRLIADDRPTS
jgi:hypothetical protein